VRIGRLIFWTFLILVVVAVGTVGVLYYRACTVPDDYEPLALSPAEKARAIRRMEDKLLAFGTAAGIVGGRSTHQTGVMAEDRKRLAARGDIEIGERHFIQRFSSDDLNHWIASMPDDVTSALHSAGMSQPAVAIGKDRLTFYSHWEEFDKIVGVDLDFQFNADQTMTIQVRSARVGTQAIPERFWAEQKDRIAQQIPAYVKKMMGAQEDFAGLSPHAYGDIASDMANAIEGRPVNLDIRYGFGNVRIKNIELKDGELVMEVVSLLPEGGNPDAGSDASGGD